MKVLIPVYESRLHNKQIRVLYSIITKKHYIITIKDGKLDTEEINDYQYILDFITANEIYKNEHYNLNQYPQIEDFV